MDCLGRDSLPDGTCSDNGSPFSPPTSPSDTEAPTPYGVDYEDRRTDQVESRFARQVEEAAARGDVVEGAASPQLDPQRQLLVLQQERELLMGHMMCTAADAADQQNRLRHEEWLDEQSELLRRRTQAAAHVQPVPVDSEGRLLKFACKQCRALFTHQNLLTRHLAEFHPVIKPFACTGCDRNYASCEVMEAHFAMVHRGERPFPCDACDKVFSRREYLQTHSRVHTGYRPYKCPECGRRFAWRGSFCVHMRTHTGERPYLCSFCNLDFSHSGSLKYHEMIHTQTFPHTCSLCERKFRRSYDLRVHTDDHEKQASPSSVAGVKLEDQVESSGVDMKEGRAMDAEAVLALEASLLV